MAMIKLECDRYIRIQFKSYFTYIILNQSALWSITMNKCRYYERVKEYATLRQLDLI